MIVVLSLLGLSVAALYAFFGKIVSDDAYQTALDAYLKASDPQTLTDVERLIKQFDASLYRRI